MIILRLVLLLVALVQSAIAYAATAAEYFPQLTKRQVAGLLIARDAPRAPLPMVSIWIGRTDGSIEWSNPNTPGVIGPREYWAERNGQVMIDAFDQWATPCIRAEMVDAKGAVFPLDCSKGHFYVPTLLPKDPWKIRAWIRVAGQHNAYWEADYSWGQAENTCWYEGTQTRDVLIQVESWWAEWGFESAQGWAFGAGPTPFDAQGKPRVITLAKPGRAVTYAAGVGIWTTHDFAANWRACTYSAWTW